VALHHAALFDCDLCTKRIRKAIYDRAVDLLVENIRIHHLPTINCRHNAMNARLAVLHGNFHHIGSVGTKASETGNPAMTPSWKRLIPRGLLGRELQDGAQSRPAAGRIEVLDLEIPREKMQPILQ